MTSFGITGVYGPSRRSEKASFLNHLRSLRPDNDAKWIVFGDFNLIYSARDKNNRNLNLSLMRRFRQALDFCQLKEIKLQNRKFTWSLLGVMKGVIPP
jgi:exonuclease III